MVNKTIKNEQGFVLITSLLILVVLMLIGIAASNTTTVELKIAGNDKATKMVFYAAEAGIEVGSAVLVALKTADKGNWDNLLQGNDLTGQTAGHVTLDVIIDDEGGGDSRKVGPAEFLLTVRDNDDLDGNVQIDSDNIIILTSSATFNDAEAVVNTSLRYNEDEYKQEHYDSSSTGVAE